MKRQSTPTLQKFVQRPNEGHVVDLMVVGDADSSLVNKFDLGTLPAPDRRFSADAAGILVDRSMIKLLFGQRQPVGTGLLSLVVVCMTFEAVLDFLGTVDDEFKQKFESIETKLPAEELSDFQERAEQTVVLNSSIVLAGYSGSLGCFDFYFASPFSVKQVAIYKKLSVEPVVRVNLPATLLFAILRGLKQRSSADNYPMLGSRARS